MSYEAPAAGQDFNRDARLYMITCASCHCNSGRAPLLVRTDLALDSAVNMPDPTNLLQVILRGVGAHEGARGAVMRRFASALSDSDVARIAAYPQRTCTNLPPWRDLEAEIATLSRQITASEKTVVEHAYISHHWPRSHNRRRGRRSAAVGHPQCRRTYRHELRLWHWHVRRLHGARRPIRSCVTRVGSVAGAEVTTIEGLDPAGQHTLQRPGSGFRFPGAAIVSPAQSSSRHAC